MKSGAVLGAGLVAVALVFGAALWWFQTRAYYHRVDGLTSIDFRGTALPVTDYRGIDADSSPLKLRACFRQDWTIDAEPAKKPTPLVAPDWFDCFDAGAIGADLEAGRAVAYTAETDTPAGFDRLVAVYPDGRGYMWRQLNEKYAD